MKSDLEPFFNPKTVAVVGASARKTSVGGVIFRNFLKPAFKGVVYPVNPRTTDVLTIPSYDKVSTIPDNIDLAVLAVPASIVPKIMLDCEEKGVKAAIIISGGFKETGSEGAYLEQQIIEVANRSGIRVIGPNCVGIYDTNTGVDTTFLPASRMGRPTKGYISFISQSGAFAAAILDMNAQSGLGVSRVISFGNKADVNEIDLIRYLGQDSETRVIVEYLEGLSPSTGGTYIQTAKDVTPKKPIIVVKAGRSQRGSAAAASHTGALAGDARLYDFAFQQAGILVARDFEDGFDMAKALATQPPAAGNRILIVTDAGGAGVMTVDACEALGLVIPETPEQEKQILHEAFPGYCSVHNPIDLTGDTDARRYQIAFETLLGTPHYDAAIAIVMMQVPLLDLDIVDRLVAITRKFKKPVVACTSGGRFTMKGASLFEEAGIPALLTPARAAKAIWALVEYGQHLKRIQAQSSRTKS
ncbi:MAG: acetate--CoA ligase family protein [Candidatus Thorarchaeota archaeon]